MVIKSYELSIDANEIGTSLGVTQAVARATPSEMAVPTAYQSRLVLIGDLSSSSGLGA